MNNRTTWLILLSLSFPILPDADARDYGRMYSHQELQRASSIYSKNVSGLLYEDIARYLLDGELQTLRRVELIQPVDRTEDPFEFSASARSGVILIPTFSVKFLDDLSIALAWYERNGCNKEAIFDYVSALDFSPRDLAAPLPALAVPENAYESDNFVDDVSQKTLKSALAFIALHELGHVHHRHRPYSEVTAQEAQAQEIEADRFALRVLRRMRTPPLGMSVWFMAGSSRDPLRENSPRQTHPMSHDRLQSIAETLRQHPEDFIAPDNRSRWDAGVIEQLADNIEDLASGLADPDLRSLLRKRGRAVTPELLKGACRSEQHRREWDEKFRAIWGAE